MILAIFLVSLFAISAVSAEDNVTTDDENYNARIIAKDINQEYDPINGNTVLFNIVDRGGKAIDDAEPTVKYDDRRAKVVYDDDHYFSKKQGTYYLDKDAEIGNHYIGHSKLFGKTCFHKCQDNQNGIKNEFEKVCNYKQSVCSYESNRKGQV